MDEFIRSELAKQGVVTLTFILILFAGSKNLWQFTFAVKEKEKLYSDGQVALLAEKDRAITSLREVIAVQKDAYEARLVEKEQELKRIAERLLKSEGYTDQLIKQAIAAVEIAKATTTGKPT